MTVHWKRQSNGGYFGYSRDVVIGLVWEVEGISRFGWCLKGVNTKYICNDRGECSSESEAKAALEAEWEKWLCAVGLAPVTDGST